MKNREVKYLDENKYYQTAGRRSRVTLKRKKNGPNIWERLFIYRLHLLEIQFQYYQDVPYSGSVCDRSEMK